MFTYDLKGNTTQVVVLKSQAVTGTVNGSAVDVREYIGALLLLLNCAAATAGSSPTMDVKIQDSADGSTGWADLSPAVAFTQVTSSDSFQALGLDTHAVRGYIRAVTTIGGTSSPSFPLGVALVGHKQRVT